MENSNFLGTTDEDIDLILEKLTLGSSTALNSNKDITIEKEDLHPDCRDQFD